MLLNSLFILFCIAIDVAYVYFLWWVPRQDEKRAAEIAAWKRYFKEQVASGWIFHDGIGG